MTRGGRTAAGIAAASAGLTLVTTVLAPARTALTLPSITLIYLVCVVAVAVVGGVWQAVATAVVSDVLVNFFFVEPYHTFQVSNRDNLITLLVYVAVAVTVSVAVDLAARQRASAVRNGLEAALLARITAAPVGEGSVTALLEHIRGTLDMTGAALTEHGNVVATAGVPPGDSPALSVPANDHVTLVADGQPVFAPDPRFLHRLAAAAARTLQAERLAAQAARARELAEVDRLRAALLAAVGHDLRTPLAGTKAAVSSLRDPDLALTEAHRAELLGTIEESTDRMSGLVENLLAMSRLQAGALSAAPRPVALDEVVAVALLHDHEITVDVPEDLPLAHADPGLLERVVANLADNAVRTGAPVEIVGGYEDGVLSLRVVDHGPGIPDGDVERIFTPFQRLGDHTADGGLGLGLAIARGFTEAMGGTLTPARTPGGGLTMTVTLPAAERTPR